MLHSGSCLRCKVNCLTSLAISASVMAARRHDTSRWPSPDCSCCTVPDSSCGLPLFEPDQAPDGQDNYWHERDTPETRRRPWPGACR